MADKRLPKTSLIDLTTDERGSDNKFHDPAEMIEISDESIVEVDEDQSDDDDLRRAIALSLQDQKDSQRNTQGLYHSIEAISPDSLTSQIGSPPTQTSITTVGQGGKVINETTTTRFLGLDRRAMEAERLARLKRKRDTEHPPHADITIKTGRSISPPPFTSRSRTNPAEIHTKTPTVQRQNDTGVERKVTTIHTTCAAETVQNSFPDGRVFKTHCPGEGDLTTDSISFNALLSSSTPVKACLLSSFIWDFDWLFPHFDTKTTKLLLVMHSDPNNPHAHQQQLRNDFAGINNVRLCFPLMAGLINCMHSKLMLLFYEDKCRIVIPTANLTASDWGEGGIMENMLWTMDLPLSREPYHNHSLKSTAFKTDLIHFLYAQTVPDDLIQRLKTFDFTKTSNIGFVHSIGGMHADNEWRSTGQCQLGRVVRQLNLDTVKPIDIDYVVSSVGSLNDEFMRSIYLAAQGDDGSLEYTLRKAKLLPAEQSDKHKDSVTTRRVMEWRENFRFYFPSQETVRRSKGGPANAQTICFSEKWWKAPGFPRQNMRDCQSVRQGLLMHNKLLLVRSSDTNKEKGFAWAYVGSANLSESAWGKIVHDRKTKSPKLNCRNWECGIVLPVQLPLAKELKLDNDRLDVFHVFRGVVPIPMLQSSAMDNGKIPWFFRH